MGMEARLLSFLLLCCFPVGAIAQPEDKSPEVGVGVVCDTAQQVERFLALHTPGKAPEVAVALVNNEANSRHACGAVAVAFVPGKTVANVAVEGGTMRVIEVMIIATVTQTGLRPIAPLTQYTAVFVKSEEA